MELKRRAGGEFMLRQKQLTDGLTDRLRVGKD
jgi:hypothetical protein